MFYINGISTDLEPYALCAFNQLSHVGGNTQVTLVAQLARPKDAIAEGFQCPHDSFVPVTSWSGARRFVVEQGTTLDKPFPGQELGDINMRSDKALSDFVQWATTYFPAKHYSLIFWDHGIESPRLMIFPRAARMANHARQRSYIESHRRRDDPKAHQRHDSPFLSVYRDPETEQPLLLNSQLKSALSSALAGRKLDIIEFDACLKSMVETAYAMKDNAEIMIANEDEVEAGQWDYESWISRVKADPNINARQLANAVFTSYVAIHDNDESFPVSQSVIDLSAIDDLAEDIDKFVDTVINHPKSAALLASARNKITLTYAGMNGVDLAFFLDNYTHPQLESVPHAADLRLRTSLTRALLANYSNYKSGDLFGSNGLSIYFPQDPSAYSDDTDCIGYDETNSDAIAFARQHRWKQLLLATWNVSESPICKASWKEKRRF